MGTGTVSMVVIKVSVAKYKFRSGRQITNQYKDRRIFKVESLILVVCWTRQRKFRYQQSPI